MKKVATLLAMALCATLATFPAVAGTTTHEGAGIKIWYPDDWKTGEDEEVFELFNGPNADDSEAYMYFYVTEAGDVQEAAGEVDQDIAKWVKGVTWGAKPVEGAINGMPALVLDGVGSAIGGKYDGKKVDISVAFVGTPGGKILLIYGQFLKGGPKADKLGKDVTKIIQGLKPL